MEEIHIEYKAVLKNYYEAGKYSEKNKKLRYKIEKLMEILIIICGIIFCFMKNFILGGLFLISGTVFITGTANKFVIFLYYNLYIKKRGLEKLTISEDKLIYEIKNIKSELKWEMYKGFAETPLSILLFYNKSQYAVIPKNAFEGCTLDEFLNLLKRKFN